MLAPAIRRYQQQLLALYPPDLRDAIAGSIDELMRDAVALAREVEQAERSEIRFADAVRDTGRFRMMARVHFGLLDLLQTEFNADDRRAIEQVIGTTWATSATDATEINIDELRRGWFAAAASAGDNLSGPLMRFLIYQAMRLNAWVLTWQDGALLEVAGAFVDLDRRAEDHLRHRIAQTDMHHPAVRPLHVLVADAVQQLATSWEQRKRDLETSAAESVERFHQLAGAAQLARSLQPADAALVRNEIDGATGGQQLGSRELSERCPSLASHNAADQRRRRLVEKLRSNTAPTASGQRFIDLVARL